MDSHESKRILLSPPDYYTPKLPKDANLLTVSSDRVAGDVHSYVARQEAPHASTSYPQLPDDIRRKLAHVGMNARMSVLNGHKTTTRLPSYQGPNRAIKASASQTVYEAPRNDSALGSFNDTSFQQPQPARRFYSEGDQHSNSSAPRKLGAGTGSRSLSARKTLKRTHNDAHLEEVKEESQDSQAMSLGNGSDTDTDDDTADTNSNGISTAATTFGGNSSNSANAKRTFSAVFSNTGSVSNSIAQPSGTSASNDDFEEAPFLVVT